MPQFSSLKDNLELGKEVTKEELIRAIRFFIAAEYEAVQMYKQIANATNDLVAKKVLEDIANEEKVHAGEFLKLLYYLDPEELEFYKKGYEEVEDIIAEIGKGEKK